MKKFRDMTDIEKLEIINAMIVGVDISPIIEFTGGGNPIYGQINPHNSAIVFDCYYEIPKRPMSIDWSVLKDEYICAARDERGSAFVYQAEPTIGDTLWGGGRVFHEITALKSYDPGTVDWTESLIWRPGYGKAS